MQDIKDYIKNYPTKEHWERVGIFHHHGFCIPLFSIHTKNSYGIGEYLDLIPLIDWCKSLNMDTIQLLPLNETGNDPSPYNSISAYALDPIYLSLHLLPYVDDYPELLEMIENIKHLNNEKRVPYKQLKDFKHKWLRKYFKYAFNDIKKDKLYKTFLKQNQWLKEYAVFKELKKENNETKWSEWPEKFQNITEENLSSVLEEYKDQLDYYYFVQYLCFSQMIKVKDYATKKRILLVGDIPILISPDSVDVWFYKNIFDMTHTAGAPPDSFNFHGQNWGFPLFNWDALKKDDYSWWRKRLNIATSCYHIYRIDHTVGFFRIWAILPNDTPLQGKFLPKDPERWFPEGKEKLLMMINASPMFPMAEDLGLIPKQVYIILKELGILSTKLMRFETEENHYIKVENYEPISITTTGTHDSETLQLWWQNNPKDAIRYAKERNWTYSKDLTYEQRKSILKDAHHSASLFHVNPLQEYLALFKELVYEDPKDERINIPGFALPTNWTYRLKQDLDSIISNKELAKEIKEIIS